MVGGPADWQWTARGDGVRGVEREVLALNEAAIWSRSPNESEVNPSTREYRDQMRRLLFEGRYAEGNALCHESLGLGSEQRQTVYHFACGYAVEDRRLIPDDIIREQ